MSAYYNEFDPAAAAWLRELIAAGQIAPGDVDNRSIVDVRPDDLVGYRQCHFFAGIGVWSHALRLAGWPDDREVWTGSCPCQPFSLAGKGKGTADERHLWPVWFRLIAQCRPVSVLGEQVEAAIRHGWIDLVQDDLEGIGYACGAVCLPAAGVGAPHIRSRLWFVAERMADADEFAGGKGRALDGRQYQGGDAESRPGLGDRGVLGVERVVDTIDPRLEGLSGHGDERNESGRHGAHAAGSTSTASAVGGFWSDAEWIACRDGKSRPAQPGIFPLVDGSAGRVVRGGDQSSAIHANETAEASVMRLRGYGNAIVPQVAADVVAAYMEWAA